MRETDPVFRKALEALIISLELGKDVLLVPISILLGFVPIKKHELSVYLSQILEKNVHWELSVDLLYHVLHVLAGLEEGKNHNHHLE